MWGTTDTLQGSSLWSDSGSWWGGLIFPTDESHQPKWCHQRGTVDWGDRQPQTGANKWHWRYWNLSSGIPHGQLPILATENIEQTCT